MHTTLVKVEWTDAKTHTGWFTPAEVLTREVAVGLSVGLVLPSDLSQIRLTNGLMEGDACDVFCIPAGCIRRLWLLAGMHPGEGSVLDPGTAQSFGWQEMSYAEFLEYYHNLRHD